jgi:DNA-directed RNA polymerase specialized sigma24 family protein
MRNETADAGCPNEIDLGYVQSNFDREIRATVKRSFRSRPDEWDDTVQEVYKKLGEVHSMGTSVLERYDPTRAHPRVYILMFARQICNKLLRKEGRRVGLTGEVLRIDDEVAEWFVAECDIRDPNTPDISADVATVSALRRMFGAGEEQVRDALECVVFQDMRIPEAARRAGLTERQLRYRLLQLREDPRFKRLREG